MSHPPNICAYCGKPGRSKEHHWGKWLAKHIAPATPNSTHTVTRADHTTGQMRVEQGPLTRQGNVRSQQIKAPCRDCNSGWMKATNEAAKEAILSLIDSGPTVLSATKRQAFASWATMLSMTYEFADLATMVTTQTERAFLMEKRRPPANWSILVGTYAGGRWAEMHNHRAMVVWAEGAVPDQANSQCNVFTLGRTAVVVLGGVVGKRRDATRFARKNRLGVLWPLGNMEPQGADPTPLDDDDMFAIAKYF